MKHKIIIPKRPASADGNDKRPRERRKLSLNYGAAASGSETDAR